MYTRLKVNSLIGFAIFNEIKSLSARFWINNKAVIWIVTGKLLQRFLDRYFHLMLTEIILHTCCNKMSINIP